MIVRSNILLKKEKEASFFTQKYNEGFVNNLQKQHVFNQSYSLTKTTKTKQNPKIICIKREPTFQEILKNWEEVNYINQKGSTQAKYEYLIKRHILPELGNVPVSYITTETLNSFASEKLSKGRLDNRGGLSPAYVRSMMIIISSALRLADKKGGFNISEAIVFKPHVTKSKLNILSQEEQKKLENFLIKDINPTKLGVLLSLNCGLRIGEICALQWENIDLENKTILVKNTVSRIKKDDTGGTILVIDTPKTMASLREVPIHSRLLPIIEKMYSKENAVFVVSESENFVSPRTYEYRYHRLLQECGIGKYNYHTLRHTFATKCVLAGVDVKTLSEILGHSNTSITLNTYVHPSSEMKLRQIEKINSLDW